MKVAAQQSQPCSPYHPPSQTAGGCLSLTLPRPLPPTAGQSGGAAPQGRSPPSSLLPGGGVEGGAHRFPAPRRWGQSGGGASLAGRSTEEPASSLCLGEAGLLCRETPLPPAPGPGPFLPGQKELSREENGREEDQEGQGATPQVGRGWDTHLSA